MLSGSVDQLWCWKKLSTLPHPPATCCHPTTPPPWCLQEHFVWSRGKLVVLKPAKNQERLTNHSWKDDEGQQQGLGSVVARCSAWSSGASSEAGAHRSAVGAVQERVGESSPGEDSDRVTLGSRAQSRFWCLAAYSMEREHARRLCFVTTAQKRYSEYLLLVVWFDTWHTTAAFQGKECNPSRYLI